MNIIQNINKKENIIQLFGNEFFENNKDNCYLLIEGNKYNLTLFEMKPINNMSYMFYGCDSLKVFQIFINGIQKMLLI